jgi:predicted DNA-binding transcriptional regulator AlpA
MRSRPRIRPAEGTATARFAALLAEVEAVGRDLLSEQIPTALGALEKVRAALWLRGSALAPERKDRLLTAEEAAAKLGIPVAAIYRKRFPFRVKVTPGRVRYSERGIEDFMRSRLGR